MLWTQDPEPGIVFDWRLVNPLEQPHAWSSLRAWSQNPLTLTAYTMGLTYSKRTKAAECQGMIGIDQYPNNVTAADSVGNIIIHDLSRITKTKLASRQTIARFKRSDDRIRQRMASKYGRIQRNRTNWLLHNVSRNLLNHATKNRFGIVVERITGIGTVNSSVVVWR